MNLNINTVLVLMGPTGCGKTHFAKNIAMPKLQSICGDSKVIYLSSDKIRRELLNDNYSKDDPRFIEVSDVAFHLLYTKLEAYMTFPVNKQFIVLDTTGMSPIFHEKVLDICTKRRYNMDAVIFDYKNSEEYYYPECDKKSIRKHIERLRQNVLPHLKTFNRRHIIKEKILDNNFTVNVMDLDLYNSYCRNDKNYFVIGDVHSCVDELKNLLLMVNFEINSEDLINSTDKTEDTSIVFIGDLIDKGSKTKETIDFIHKNIMAKCVPIIVITGNHEHAIANLLTGVTKESEHPVDFINSFYNSYFDFKKDSDLKDKFLQIVDDSYPFMIYTGLTGTVYMSHSPCHTKYLGKMDGKSKSRQRYLYQDRRVNLQQNIRGFLDSSKFNQPYHIVGHFAIKNIYDGRRFNNNMLMIDTGAVHGGFLSGVLIGDKYPKPKFYKSKFTGMQKAVPCDLPDLNIKPKDKDLDKKFNELSPFIKNRIDNLAQDSVNFISGTISPADKNQDTNNLEDLMKGAEYYKKLGISTLSVQRKYMGSRCNVYLDMDDVTKSYSISRNGRKVKTDGMESVYLDMYTKLEKFALDKSAKLIILDGELMPWAAIGSGLIETQFKTTATALERENKMLTETGFDKLYEEYKQSVDAVSFKEDMNSMSKKDITKKYGTTQYASYKMLFEHTGAYMTPEERTSSIETYNRQLELYGKSGELHYKPFNILKIVHSNGTETIPGMKGEDESMTQNDIFSLISTDTFLRLNMDDDDWDVTLQKFYDLVTSEDDMEGIVIKPEYLSYNLVPSIKVRNPKYLTIIYGHDYKTKNKFSSLIKQKRITGKLRASLREFQCGYKMLKIPHDEISLDNSAYVELLMNFIDTEKHEEHIDPRL